MASDTTLRAAAPSVPTARTRLRSRACQVAGWAILGLLAALLLEVLFEGWVQQIAGHPARTAQGSVIHVLADWPKTVKTLLFVALAGATLVKIAIERTWRDYLSKADLALVTLGAVMVLAGLLGGSKLSLIAQGLFVYFRGAIVFYAWRALNPSWRSVKPVLIGVGAVAVLSSLIATIEWVFGYQSYLWFGWTDLTWARLSRAHALFNHPNNLGHFLMIVLLGMLAWFTTQNRVARKWWWLFGFLAFGLSASQSRESTIGIVIGAAVIWLLRRPTRKKPIAIALLLVLGFAGLQLGFTAQNRAVLFARVKGVFAAINLGAGSERAGYCVTGDPQCDEADGIDRREIRVLFAQQSVRIWSKRPVTGYGVGQFGGIVAFKADPNWNQKFHFNLYGAKPDQVDSFWLHLLVETGALGVLAYFVWLFFLIAPMVRARTRGPGVHPFVLWGPAVMAATLLVALLSPAPEDPLYPTLLFTVLGLGWVVLHRGESAGAVPATGLNGPATTEVDLAAVITSGDAEAPARTDAPHGDIAGT
jgi:hypothetical protein